jgi:hypothetical protein
MVAVMDTKVGLEILKRDCFMGAREELRRIIADPYYGPVCDSLGLAQALQRAALLWAHREECALERADADFPSPPPRHGV